MKKWELMWKDTGGSIPICYGKKGSKKAVWINHWDKRQWAVIVGKDIPTKEGETKLKEDYVLANTFSRKDAEKQMQDFMQKNHRKRLTEVV